MKTVKEIDKQIEKEHNYIIELHGQIKAREQRMKFLLAERKITEKKENKIFIDNWLNEHFGIQSQEEARQKSIFIVFDQCGNFIKAVTTGYGEEFHYVSPVEDEDTMEHWLRENKLYAHRASSFCDRDRSWYDLSFKEQLENLCWIFGEDGRVKKTQW